MRRRRAVILGLGGTGAAVAFMLGLGTRHTRSRPAANAALPLPISDMAGCTPIIADKPFGPRTGLAARRWCYSASLRARMSARPLSAPSPAGWKNLGTEADRLTVARISVDPERDTLEVLADYV